MKIVLIGAGGDIGKAVRRELEPRHELITAGRSSGDIHVNMADMASVRAMYAETGPVDAVVSAAGNVHFGPLSEFTQETFMLGLQDKVMGQVNLVLAGMDVVNDAGSFTLTSGVLDRDPIRMGAAAATANGALGGFVVGDHPVITLATLEDSLSGSFELIGRQDLPMLIRETARKFQWTMAEGSVWRRC